MGRSAGAKSQWSQIPKLFAQSSNQGPALGGFRRPKRLKHRERQWGAVKRSLSGP